MTRPVRFVVLGGSAPATVQLIDALAAGPMQQAGSATETVLAAGRAEAGPAGRGSAGLDIVLHGRSAERLNAVAGAGRQRAASLRLAVTVTGVLDRAAALAGAGIVLNQIRPGGLEQRAVDESFPRDFGLPGEETLGPGGFACAIRTVTALRPVWADVAEYAPDALVINLTNPAGIVAQAARLAFGLDIVSVCDSPLDLLGSVARRLGRDDVPNGRPADQPGGKHGNRHGHRPRAGPGGQLGHWPGGGPDARLRSRYVGMNHVGWYIPESAAELDLLAGLVSGIDPDLPRLHGALPGSYLRYYAHPDRMLAAQQGKPTRADELIEIAQATLETFSRGQIPAAWQRAAPWYSLAVVPLASAWLTGSAQPLILGLPNDGRLAWLPDDATVEGPTLVPLPGQIQALPLADLPDLPRGLLAHHAAYERLTAHTLAAGQPTDEDLTRALLANPMVTSLNQARGLTAAIVARMSGTSPGWR